MDTQTHNTFAATVYSEEVIAREVKKITFRLGDRFEFLPGQYIWLDLGLYATRSKMRDREAFSIACLPNAENRISIISRKGESAYKKKLFSLRKNDAVSIHGPFGSSFTLDVTRLPTDIVFIAGGVGIAPFYSVLLEIAQKQYPISCKLMYGNVSKEQTPLLDELHSLKKRLNGFAYTVHYDIFSPQRLSHHIQSAKESAEWWISGKQEMVNHVTDELVARGISSTCMRFENFYPSLNYWLRREEIEAQLKGGSIFAKAIQNSSNHTIITNPNGQILFASKAAERMTGYTESEMLGNTPRLWGGIMGSEFYVEFWQTILSGKAFIGEIKNRRKNGEMYYTIAHISPLFDEKKRLIGFIGTEEDITNIKKHEQDLQRLNTHMIGRELKMIELKKKIRALKK